MNTLFKTIEEFSEHLAIDANFNIETLAPSINLAEVRYLQKIIGKGLYAEVLQEYTADSLSAKNILLLKKVKMPLAYLALSLYLPIGNVSITEAGVHIIVNDNQKPAFEWQVVKTQEALQEIGYNGMDLLLEFLEENKLDYSLWTASTAYSEFNSHLIRNTTEFQECYNINSSRLVFLALLPKLVYSEDFILSNNLCEYFEILKTRQASGSLTAPDLIVLPYLKKALARYTIASGLADLSIEASVFGVIQNDKAGSSNYKGFKPASLKSIDGISSSAEKEAKLYLDKVILIMQTNIADYPIYAASSCYDEDGSTRTTGNLDEMRPRTYDSFFRT
jgi:hypothetical protein